jgi:hypothetical protein
MAETLREPEPETCEEVSLRLVGACDAAQADDALLKVGQRQDDVSALDARELAEDGPWRVTKPRSLLPLFEGLPECEGKKADQEMRLDTFLLLVPDGPDGQVALLDAKGGLGIGELDVGLPEISDGPLGDIAAEDVAALIALDDVQLRLDAPRSITQIRPATPKRDSIVPTICSTVVTSTRLPSNTS